MCEHFLGTCREINRLTNEIGDKYGVNVCWHTHYLSTTLEDPKLSFSIYRDHADPERKKLTDESVEVRILKGVSDEEAENIMRDLSDGLKAVCGTAWIDD